MATSPKLGLRPASGDDRRAPLCTFELHAAATSNFGGGFSAELGLVETKDRASTKGIRPALTYASGPLTLKLGGEAIKWAAPAVGTAQRSETGVGFTAAYDISGIKPILSLAAVKDGAGRKQQTYGLIVDTSFVTVGYIHGAYSTPSRTAFQGDGGQHSAVMADSVPR